MPPVNPSPFNVTLIGPAPPHVARLASSPQNRYDTDRESKEIIQVLPLGSENVRPIGGRRPRIVMSELAEMSGPLDPRCVLLRDRGSVQARSYRLLRHRLGSNLDPHVIAVTSGGDREGKTTCAINLALAIAEGAMTRVLLVEANPLRPSLAQVFGVKSRESLNTWTTGATGEAWPLAVANVKGTRLDIAAACPGTSGLDRFHFGNAVADVRDVYDYVVIDTPSVLASNDANIVAECADAVILTALAAKSSRSALRRALDQLHPANIAGVVLLDA